MNKFAKGLIVATGAGALCFLTGGLAAPAIGSFVGSTFMGLSGAAATSAGLAALGGGALASGGAGMAGGTALVSGIAAGLGATGAGLGTALHSGNEAKRDLKETKQQLKDLQHSETYKQEIIVKYKAYIETLKSRISDLEKDGLNHKEEIDRLKKKISMVIDYLHQQEAA